MGLFTKDIQNMDDLFVHTLRDIYYAENQIAKSLPDMIDKATDTKLRQGFEKHLAESSNPAAYPLAEKMRIFSTFETELLLRANVFILNLFGGIPDASDERGTFPPTCVFA